MAITTDPKVFEAAYWASKPPEVQRLHTITDQGQREPLAVSLANQGFIIDTQIMVWGWSAYWTMFLREQYGYTWVPSLMQPPVLISPGLNNLPVTPYDPKHIPAGAIKVSLDLDDYPPFTPVVIPPDQTPTSVIGVWQGVGNIWTVAMHADTSKLKNMEKVNGGDKGNFVYHLVKTPFGFNEYFTKE